MLTARLTSGRTATFRTRAEGGTVDTCSELRTVRGDVVTCTESPNRPASAVSAQASGFGFAGQDQQFIGGLVRGVVDVATDFIPGPIDDFIADRVIDRFSPGGRGPAAPQPGRLGPGPTIDPCPGGFRIPGTNRCFETPITPQAAPAGSPATGPVAPGAFGALSTSPFVETRTVMRCPPGLVLGKDNRCYTTGKGGISNAQRKYPRQAKPPISRADMKAIRRAAAAQKRVKKLAGDVGFSCKKR